MFRGAVFPNGQAIFLLHQHSLQRGEGGGEVEHEAEYTKALNSTKKKRPSAFGLAAFTLGNDPGISCPGA
jgi:hypothetical protein